MEAIFEKENVKIYIDEDPEDPRSWDNVGTMVCFHGRYELGDKHEIDQDKFGTWDEMRACIEANIGPCVILPLYLYDHGGITMNTTGFSCSWDSGAVGFIYCSEATAKEEGIEPDKLEARLIGEVAVYDQYLRGEVYGFIQDAPPQYSVDYNTRIFKGEEILFRIVDASASQAEFLIDALNAFDPGESDSCWGFYMEPEELANAVLKGEV